MTSRTEFENPDPTTDLAAEDLEKILSLQGEMLKRAVVRSDYSQLLDELCQLAESFTPNAVAAIMLYDPDTDCLFVANGPSLSAEAIEAFNGLRSGDGSCGNAVYHDEAMYVCNTIEDPRWARISDIAVRFNICSCFSFPVHDTNGDVIASFSISSFEPRTPDGFHRALLEACTNICSVILQRRSDEELKRRLLEEQIKTERVDSLGILAGGIAHDFNNLLAAIMGNVDLTESTLPNGPEKEGLQLAMKAIESASELTRQLLTVSKGGNPIREPNDIGGIIRDSGAFALHGSSVSFELTGIEDLASPFLNVDGGQIGQLIQNLVINSRQAMPHGGVVRIHCESVDDQDHFALNSGKFLRITVKDNGEGIDAASLERLFEPYFTTRETGSGLGLFLCYSIVKRHGGNMFVESEKGKGTLFTIYLPQDENDTCPQSAVVVQQRHSSTNVLIMDDDRLVRKTLSRMLRQLGCQVWETSDGREAIERFTQQKSAGNPIDITILDLTVPGGMGGVEAKNVLRDHDADAKIVVSSGYSAGETCVKYESAGFDQAMLKPYRLAELKRVLASLLD